MSVSTYLRDKFPGFYRRRLHCYSIGAAKTGTTSVAAMFSPEYRAAHENEIEDLNHKIIEYLNGEITTQNMEHYLRQRDGRLNLDIESSHPLGYVVDLLVENHPEAKFIITLREPYSWLNSRLNYHHQVDPPKWREYREYFWARNQKQYAKEEMPLEKYNLYSLDVYLAQYADHYRRLLSVIPEDRRLLIKTHELANSRKTIAEFIGIQERELRTFHTKRGANKITPIQEMDPSFVRKKIWAHCEDLIRGYFKETVESYR